MVAMLYFEIYRTQENLPTQETLQFQGRNFKLLNPILLDNMRIVDDGGDLIVQFFTDSPFQQTLHASVEVIEGLPSPKDIQALKASLYSRNNSERISRAVLRENVEVLNKEVVAVASYLVRGSQTLSATDLRELSNEWRMIDTRGLVVFSKLQNLTHAKRELLLFLLGWAYQLAMQEINQRLANCLQGIEPNINALEKLYQDAAIFNARYFFRQPVAAANYPSVQVWKDIAVALSLEEQNAEVEAQISNVYQILSHSQQKQTEKHERELIRQESRRNLILGIVGLFVSILSLLELARTFNWL